MPKRIERLIDEALLHTATLSGVLYVQRRTRRALPKIAIGTAVFAGVGVAAATTAAGVGAVGLAGGAVTWYRKREKARAPLAAAGGPPTVAESNGPDYLAKDNRAEPAPREMEPRG
jgi:hypothetical protein